MLHVREGLLHARLETRLHFTNRGKCLTAGCCCLFCFHRLCLRNGAKTRLYGLCEGLSRLFVTALPTESAPAVSPKYKASGRTLPRGSRRSGARPLSRCSRSTRESGRRGGSRA